MTLLTEEAKTKNYRRILPKPTLRYILANVTTVPGFAQDFAGHGRANGLRATSTEVKSNPLLVALLMIKDEAHCIEKTLQPLIEGGIKDFVLLDTGSTDGTQNIVREYFKKNKVDGTLFEEPFIDFSTSRNRLLALAEGTYPNATFWLMLDANWHVYGVKHLIEFCQKQKNQATPSYGMFISKTYPDNIKEEFWSFRIFRAQNKIRYRGRVHELIDQESNSYTDLSKIWIEEIPKLIGHERSIARAKQDIGMLKLDLEENPKNPRTLYYLARCYALTKDWEHAYEYYKKRTKLKGSIGENYDTYMDLSKVSQKYFKEILGDQWHSKWPEIMGYLLKAHALCPWQIEPLIMIAQYYLETKKYFLAFLFIKPTLNKLMKVDPPFYVKITQHYTFTRYAIAAQCAWAAGEFELGAWAALKALEVEPDNEMLRNNYLFYKSMKNEVQEITPYDIAQKFYDGSIIINTHD